MSEYAHFHYLPDGEQFIVPFCLCSTDGSIVYEQLPATIKEREMSEAHAHIDEDGETILIPACKCDGGEFCLDHEHTAKENLAYAVKSGHFTDQQIKISSFNPWLDYFLDTWYRQVYERRETYG